MHAMHPSDQKGWSQDAAIPRPHLRVGSGGVAVLLEIPTYLRPSKGMQIFFSFVSVSTAVAFGLTITYCSPGLCHPAIIAVLFIAL